MARKFEELTKNWPEERKQKVAQMSKDLIIEDLKRQLAEARAALTDSRAEINRLREKLGWVPAAFDIEALREAGKRGLKV